MRNGEYLIVQFSLLFSFNTVPLPSNPFMH